MKEIDAVIDDEPTEQRIIDLAELRNRNILSFRELRYFNDKGKWLGKHPLITHNKLRMDFQKLLKEDTAGFLAEFTNTANNVSRYTSFLNNNKRSPNQHEKDAKNFKKHQERERIMREVLEDNKK